MMVKLNMDSIRNEHLRKAIKHARYLALLVFGIPLILYFELCIVLPTVAKTWSVSYFVHLFCITYLLLNVLGNLIYGSFINTSIQGKFVVGNIVDNPNWGYCSECECMTPPRAAHCSSCNTCILKRDHHCTFFASCVGYFNHRYFIFFTFYVFVAAVYAFYYNVKFLAQILNWNDGLLILKFLLPLANIVINFDSESLYILYIGINAALGLLSGFLLLYHFRNLLSGRTCIENKYDKDISFNHGWKANIVEVFGYRWYLTWILPFIHSPLPGNGIDWIVKDKFK